MQWSVDRGKAKSRQAKITSDALQALDMNRIIGEILNAPLCGYQPLEVLWGKVGGWILPIDVVGKPRNWFAFDASNNPRFLTKVDMILGEELPPKQFLFARYEPTYDNPYGFPLLSRCFWPVTFKKGGYKFWVTFLEKFGMPFLWGKLPRGLGKKEYDDLYDILERMVTDAVAVTPDDGSISMIESKGSSGSSDIYEKFLTFADSEVSKAIVGQTLTTQVGEKGSYATSQTHMEVRNDIVLGDKRLCESTMNQLIIWIDELNFQSGNPPTFSLYKEEDVDLTLAERDDKLD
jgi:phage gp29-like protein